MNMQFFFVQIIRRTNGDYLSILVSSDCGFINRCSSNKLNGPKSNRTTIICNLPNKNALGLISYLMFSSFTRRLFKGNFGPLKWIQLRVLKIDGKLVWGGLLLFLTPQKECFDHAAAESKRPPQCARGKNPATKNNCGEAERDDGYRSTYRMSLGALV